MPEFDDSKGASADLELSSTETAISIQPGEEIKGLEPDQYCPAWSLPVCPRGGFGRFRGKHSVFAKFFSPTPRADTGAAYVVVLHLSPEHESTLAEVLQHSAKIPVIQVNRTMTVEPNKVYVIPPAKKLFMTDGQISVLRLGSPTGTTGKRLISFFGPWRIPMAQGPVRLSYPGADSDGSIGIKRMKERGGLTVAQDPSEAMYDGMPRAAIATGMVDWILPVRDMPAQLAAYP